jgi:hypothetical protein
MILRKHRIDLVVTSVAGRDMDRVSKRLRRAGVRFLAPVREDDDDR